MVIYTVCAYEYIHSSITTQTLHNASCLPQLLTLTGMTRQASVHWDLQSVGRRSLGLYQGERGVVLLPALRIQVTALLPVPYWLILHPWHTHATSFILLYTWEEERKGRKAEGTTLSHNTHSSVVQRSLTYPGYPGTQVLSTNCSVVFPVGGCISCSSIHVENSQSDFSCGKREIRVYWGTSGEVLFVHEVYICRGNTSWFDIP